MVGFLFHHSLNITELCLKPMHDGITGEKNGLIKNTYASYK